MCRDVKDIFSCLFGAANLYYYRRSRVFNSRLEFKDKNSWVDRAMEGNYDEDLSQNPFLQELQTEYRSTFEKAIKEGWIICVPRFGSFSRGSLLENDFLSHILVPHDEKTGTYFRTLTGREVKLCNRVLTIEYDISKPCSLHMLFEETYYTEDLHKYRIWCIEHPIEQGAGTSRDHVPVVTDLRESKDLLWREVLDKNFLKDMDAEIEEFERTQDHLENKPLQVQRDLVGALYAKSLRALLKDTRLRERTISSRYFLQAIKVAVETYILHSLRNILPQSISSCTASEDASLNKTVKNLHEIQLRDLGIRSDLCDGVLRGKLELSRLDIFSTVLEKTGCLKRTIRFISQGEISVSSDDLLPVLIFLVIKSGLPNWIAQLTFMKHFRFSVNSIYEADEAGFLITSLEAAIEHVKSGVLTGSAQPEADNLDKDEGLNSAVNGNEKEKQVSLMYLFNRIEKGELTEVERILSKKDEKAEDESKLCHPLCTCESCERNLAKTLHLNWPTLNSRDDRGLTALHVASLYGQVVVVDFLLEHGANVNDADADGVTPLHCASARGHQNTLLLLLHAAADLNLADMRGNTPLHLAADHGHDGCVKALLYFAEQVRLIINVNVANFTGDTALHHASKWGYAGIVEILLEHGANPKVMNRRGLTPLGVAHSRHVSRFLEKACKQDMALVHWVRKESSESGESRASSSEKNRTKVKKQVKFLDVESPTQESHTIDKLLSAVAERDICLVSYYLGLDGPLKKIPEEESNFCHPLCTCEKCASIEEIIDKEERKPLLGINSSNKKGETALHIACDSGHVEVVQLLLDAGANVNLATQNQGQTPLHIACLKDRLKTSGDNVSANNNSSSLSTSPSPSPSTSTSAPLSDTNIIPHVQKGKKCKGSSHTGSSESGSSSDSKSVSEECTITTSKTTRQYTTPAQDTLKKETDILEKILLVKIESRGAGLAKTGAQKEIEELRKIIEQKKKLLSRKINAAKCQKRYRDETQKTMFDIKAGKLDLASSLRINEEPGRPRIEVHQPELLKTIADIAMFGGAAYDRRRSNLVRSCKILKELTAELQSTLCITISKSATYLRLLLRDSHTVEGKRHVSTVPVKLCRAQNNAKKHQIDGKFCTASIRFLEQLISVLGSKQVAVISQDDKSKVLIGLAAANRQAHLLIHLEYKITLPDHDWVVAPRHKLTPSVYAGIKIEDGKIGHPKNLSYSGPTYVAIRSAKRSSSTALAHAYDFEKLFILVSFKEILYDGEKVKPIVITSDGGSDENPHYKKAITSACHHFQLYNLDAIFIITNAPGRSAYNRVERRMANFSNELAALVLPHDHYGSHLDSAGETSRSISKKKILSSQDKHLQRYGVKWSLVDILSLQSTLMQTVLLQLTPQKSQQNGIICT